MSYVRLIHRVSYRSHDTDGNSVCGKLIGYYSTIHRAQIEASGQAESGFAGQQDQNGIIENVYAVPVEYPLSREGGDSRTEWYIVAQQEPVSVDVDNKQRTAELKKSGLAKLNRAERHALGLPLDDAP